MSSTLMGAVGIGVADLEASAAFYADVLEMEVQRSFELGYLNEVVLGPKHGAGPALVLMNWPNDGTRRYDGSDIKLVFYVGDPAAVIDRIRNRGGTIEREAEPAEVLDGIVVGLGRDPDGYTIEVIEQRAASAG